MDTWWMTKRVLVLLTLVAMAVVGLVSSGLVGATTTTQAVAPGNTLHLTCSTHFTGIVTDKSINAACSPVPTTTTTTPTTTTTTPTTTTTIPTTTTTPSTTPTTTTTTPTTTTTTQPAGSGFPDGTNTGPVITPSVQVPRDKTSGTGWHYDTRGFVTIDGANADVGNLYFTKEVSIEASGVKLHDCVIAVSHAQFPVAVRHANNVTVDHCKIFSPSGTSIGSTNLVGIKQIYGDEQNTVFTNNEVAAASTGIQLDSGLVQNNYVHDIGAYDSTSHLNGFTSNGGSESVVVRHNTILVNAGQTDAVSFFQDFGIQANKTIDNNLLAGGGYVIYGGQGSNGATHDIRITNNRISTRYYPQGGFYGWLAHFTSTDPGNVATGNVWAESGQPIPGG